MNVFYASRLQLDIVGFWKSIALLSKGMLIPAVLGVWILKYWYFRNIWQFLAGIALYTLVYCASMWLLGMNREEKALVQKPLQKMRRRMSRG